MSGKITIPCKRCQKNPVEYSVRSQKKMDEKYGDSDPEYCAECRKEHNEEKATLAVGYFNIKRRKGSKMAHLRPGGFSKVYHPERIRQLIDQPSKFDPDKFGMTEDDMRKIADWFIDPSHRVVVVVGGTGSGKSTALPYWLAFPPDGIHEDFFTRHGQIMVSQPRIVAVTSIAKFLGEELVGTTVGQGGDVGYSYSGERKRDWRNLVVNVTDGQLLNIVQAGDLKNIGLVMIDEAHERSQNIDLILRYLKEQLPLHPHLRVIIASATIEAPKFIQYFGEESTTLVEFQGKSIGYGKPHFADDDEKLPYEKVSSVVKHVIPAAVKKALQLIKEIETGRKDKGDVLVFMPGTREVDDTIEQLVGEVRRMGKGHYKVKAYRLYRDMDEEEKDRIVYADEDPNQIRIIVSTNIAEASVTLKSLVYVIETGLSKVPIDDRSTSQRKVPMTLISQDNAKQRWGRSGRTRRGEVFCLYTEDQYLNLMPEHPTPDLLRLNKQQLILNARLGGVTNLLEGWIDNPDEEAMTQDLQALMDNGALDKDQSVTDYGQLLKHFNCPAAVVNMLLTSDIYGCAIEIATLIPVIRNGGLRRIMNWDKRWSAQTKFEVFQIHRTLMDGCKDDIEFIFKVFSAWEVDPVTERKRTKAQRKAWAKRHFVNHETLLKVEEERNTELLKPLFVGKKDPNMRPIDPALIARTRMILLKFFGNDAVLPEYDKLGRYVYKSQVEPKESTVFTFSSVSTEIPSLEADLLTTATILQELGSKALEPGLFDRLFCDQLLPSSYVYSCYVEEIIGNYLRVSILDRIKPVKAVEEIQRDETEATQEDWDDDDEEENVTQKPALREVEEEFQAEFRGEISFSVFIQTEHPESYQIGYVVPAKVSSFGVREDLSVYAVLEEVKQSFEEFVASYEIGDELELEVVQSGEYPEDPKVSLVTKEPNSGQILALDPEDVVFARTDSAVSLIPVGIRVIATIIQIDRDRAYVKASMLPQVEEQMTQFVASRGDRKGVCSTTATVLETNEEDVHLLLNWSHPDEGLLYVVSSKQKSFPKPIDQVVAGERYQVSFRFNTDWKNKARLFEMPPEVESILGTRMASKLDWDGNHLVFEGRMTFDLYQELLLVSTDDEYRRALRKLYRKSNQPGISKIIESSVVESAELAYEVGRVMVVTVIELNSGGASVQVDPSIRGFVPRRKIYDHDYVVGKRLMAKVLEFDRGSMAVTFDAKIEENRPKMDGYSIGSMILVTISNLNKGGAEVEVTPEIRGFISRGKIYDIDYVVGRRFRAKIFEADQIRAEIKLDAKIDENHPSLRVQIGEVFSGQVANIQEFGVFVRLPIGIDGMLRKPRSGYYDRRIDTLATGMQVTVKVTQVDTLKKNISLELL